MTIVKIKNPVLTWLAGLAVLAVMVIIAAIILYGIGYFAQKIFPSIFFMKGFMKIMMEGYLALMLIVLGILIGAGTYAGAKFLGKKFFDQ